MAYLNVRDLENTLDMIYNQDASNERYKLKIYIDDFELEDVDDYCEKLTINDRIIPNGSKIFMLNSLVSKEAELILYNGRINYEEGKVRILLGIKTDEEAIEEEDAYEFIPMGVFNIQGDPTTNTNKTTYTLRDNSVLLDFPYNAKPLIDDNGGVVTKLQIFQDICTQFNIDTDIQDFLNSTDTLSIYDNTLTARTYIAYLAEQAGCIATFDREGKLIFININDLYKWTLPFDYLEKYEDGDSYTISKVVYEDAIRKYEAGDETQDIMFLDSANPYISSQEQVEGIANNVLGFSINSFNTGKIKGNPLIDSYDLIEIIDDETEDTFSTLATNQFIYTGVLRQTFDTQIGKDDREQNVTITEEATFRKYAKTSIDNINNNINMIVGEQNELSETISQTIQNLYSIENLFQLTGGSNLIKNSQGLLDDNVWDKNELQRDYTLYPSSSIYPMSGRYPLNDSVDRTPSFVMGYDASLIGSTIAVAKLGVSNGLLTSKTTNIVNLLVGNRYTLSYYVTNERDTVTTVRLRGNGTIYNKTFSEPITLQEETFEFIADTSDYILEIESITTQNGFGYIYDLMLNAGDKKPWEPAIGEIVGTVIKLSREGIQVYSKNSNIATLLTSEGFQIRRFENEKLYEVITEFTNNGITTNKIVYVQDNMDGLIHKAITSGGYKKYIAYIGDDD